MWELILFFVFLGPHPEHMEVPRLGVTSELWPPAYTTTTAMPDPSRVCDLHHRPRQCRILNPLSKARDRTCILMDASRVHYLWATTGTPQDKYFKSLKIRVPTMAQWVKTVCSCSSLGCCGGMDLIPRPAKRVKGSSCVSCNSGLDSVPGLGTSICHKCGRKMKWNELK